MTALADLSQNAAVPEAGIADLAITTRKLAFDTQYGAGDETNTQQTDLTTSPYSLTKSIGGVVTRLEVVYTPTEDAWWEVVGQAGQIQKSDAAWHYCNVDMVCTPTPAVNLATQGGGRQRMYNGVGGNTYHGFHPMAIFGLTANTTYTAYMTMTMDGGTWVYNRGSVFSFIYGKGWGR